MEIKRARPLLGTIVEISAEGPEDTLNEGIDAAFQRIEELDEGLSPVNSRSEPSQLSFQPSGVRIQISSALFEILTFCRDLYCASKSKFNPFVRPVLESIGVLPRYSEGRKIHEEEFPLRFLSNQFIEIISPFSITLAGVAKGYCVDEGVECLKRHGISKGLINAGGDLRAFGESPIKVRIRPPMPKAKDTPTIVELRNCSLATSGNYRFGSSSPGHIINGKSCEFLSKDLSVTVLAESCMTADALTKAVAFMAEYDRKSLLERYGARAVIICDQVNN